MSVISLQFRRSAYQLYVLFPTVAHMCFMSCFPQFCTDTSRDCSELSLLSGPAYLLNMPEKRIEKRKREKTEDSVRRALSEYCCGLKFIHHPPFIPKQKGGGAKDFLPMIQGINKRNCLLHTQNI